MLESFEELWEVVAEAETAYAEGDITLALDALTELKVKVIALRRELLATEGACGSE